MAIGYPFYEGFLFTVILKKRQVGDAMVDEAHLYFVMRF